MVRASHAFRNMDHGCKGWHGYLLRIVNASPIETAIRVILFIRDLFPLHP